MSAGTMRCGSAGTSISAPPALTHGHASASTWLEPLSALPGAGALWRVGVVAACGEEQQPADDGGVTRSEVHEVGRRRVGEALVVRRQRLSKS
jgi:hypothetical protein